MLNSSAPFIDLTLFSNLPFTVYAVCDKHIDLYSDDKIHGTISVRGPWQCDNCPEDSVPASGTVYVVSE